VRGQLERRGHALQTGVREERVGLRPAAVAHGVLHEAVDEDDVRASEILPVAVGIDHIGAVVGDELQIERADRLTRGTAARRLPLHVQQAVGEIEVAAFDQLDKSLTILESGLVRVAEDRVAFTLHEARRRREPRADEPGQLMDDRVGMLELGTDEERRVARDVGQQQVAASGSPTQ
jgi:hypothetical protein